MAYRLALNGLATYTTWTVVAYWVNLTQALVKKLFSRICSPHLSPPGLLRWPGPDLLLPVGSVPPHHQPGSLVCPGEYCLGQLHQVGRAGHGFYICPRCRYVVTPYPVVIWASYGIRSSIMAREDVPQVGRIKP